MPELSVALPSARRDAVQLCAALPPAMHFASRAGTAPSAGSAALCHGYFFEHPIAAESIRL